MKIELITWIDAVGCGTDWEEMCDMKTEPALISSVGYIKETEDYVVVIPHYAKGTSQGCGEMAIPKVAIKERVDLTNKGDKQ